MQREWKRYEGTPQRELFRELRVRFLERHRRTEGWSLDLGSGPGRFAGSIGSGGARTVLLDLSAEALRSARQRVEPWETPSMVRGDAGRPPLRDGAFASVVALGNVLGFAGHSSEGLLDRATGLVGPGGLLVLEVVCGPGESSRYLRRLPPGAVRRLLAAPMNLVRGRLLREGFLVEAARKGTAGDFRRFEPEELDRMLSGRGFEVVDRLAVAPSLGADPLRIGAARAEPLAWLHLLELEETVGRMPERAGRAAALLLAAVRRRSGPAGPSD